jgi:hypothetical protein
MTASADPEGPTAGRFPSAAAVAALRAALGSYLRGTQSSHEEADVSAALAALAGEARAGGLHGEQLLLVLKESWGSLPEAAAMPDRHERQRLLGRLVTLCIDVYYHER